MEQLQLQQEAVEGAIRRRVERIPGASVSFDLWAPLPGRKIPMSRARVTLGDRRFVFRIACSHDACWIRRLHWRRYPDAAALARYLGMQLSPRAIKRTVPVENGVSSPAGYQEENDCTVRALANAGAVRYEDAHALLELLGRHRGEGVRMHRMLRDNRPAFSSLLGLEISFDRDHYRGKSLSTFARQNPRGRYIVTTSGHALAVVDGKVIDIGGNPLCRIRTVTTVSRCSGDANAMQPGGQLP